MPRHAYVTVDVFTSERFGGNPLAVFPEADAIDPALMPRIASELNLSETTFVSRTTRAGCDVRVRIFTPRAELAMAGHPTLGTAFVLGHDRVVFEEGIGPVPVERDGDRWWMIQPAARWEAVSDPRAAVAAALGLTEGDLADLPVEVGSSGNPFLYVPLASREALGRARLDGSFGKLDPCARSWGASTSSWWGSRCGPACCGRWARTPPPGAPAGRWPATWPATGRADR